MDSPSSIEVPRPVGKEFYTPCYIALDIWRIIVKSHARRNAISKKISSGIGSIKRISRCVPPATLHNIYHGLVQSHFDYFSVVWGNCAKTLSDKLQRL